MSYSAFQQHVLHEVYTKIRREKTKEAHLSAITIANLVSSITVDTSKDKEKQTNVMGYNSCSFKILRGNRLEKQIGKGS
jgi:hypothetical protein